MPFVASEYLGLPLSASSLLLYDQASGATKVRIIDLARVSATSRLEPPEGSDAAGALGPLRRLDHRTPWVEGNEEDGYLFGLDRMIEIFDELLCAGPFLPPSR
jgi:1D-myo-inositol-triphosphate 3-kinase